MAKGNKRQKKKQLKKKQTQKLQQTGLSEKEVRRLRGQALEKEYKKIIAQEQKKEKARKSSKQRRDKLKQEREEKLQLMEQITGVNRFDFGKYPTARFLDSLKLEDLRKGKYKRTSFKEYLPKKKTGIPEGFDFDKLYPIPNGKKLHIAFRALNGEKDIGDEIAKFERYSNEELLAFLREIKKMPQTRTKRKKGHRGRNTGSSGQAGEAVIRMSSQSALTEMYGKEYNADRRSNNFAKLLSKTAKKKGASFQHSGIDYHWQNIRQIDEDGRLKAYTKISARKLLVIANAVLWNIVEKDRTGFYNDFYAYACEIIPELRKILP